MSILFYFSNCVLSVLVTRGKDLFCLPRRVRQCICVWAIFVSRFDHNLTKDYLVIGHYMIRHPYIPIRGYIIFQRFKSACKFRQESSSNQLKRISYLARINCPAEGRDYEDSAQFQLHILNESFFIKRLFVL